MDSTNNEPQRPRRPATGQPQGSANQNKSQNRPPRKKPQGITIAQGVKGTLSVIGKTFLTIFLIMVITGSIVASVLTVYVVNFLGDETEFDLRNLQFNYTTTLYAESAEAGEPYPLQVIKGYENRIWVDFEHIPTEMQLAAKAAEDKRFMAHQGVDWKMTFKAFLNLILGGETTGGSTMTQQLIKNISNEKEVRVDRKIKEIFRALSLEKEYSKDDIMEAYLNTIALGYNTSGVQAAANLYFGKNVDELDTAECAAIIAITQNPSRWELIGHEPANRERRGYILDNMLDIEQTNLRSQYKKETKNEFGEVPKRSLTEAQYKQEQAALEKKYADAKAEELVIKSSAAQQTRGETYTYFVDYVINEVIEDMVAQLGYTPVHALDMINGGGLSIYTTVDENIQGLLDEKFITNELEYNPETSIFPKVTGRYILTDAAGNMNFGDSLGDKQPQCAMVIMDYEGNIKGIAGGRGEKTGDRTFNLATDGARQPGSAIKPLSVYGPAVDLDLIHWSYMTDDSPFGYMVGGKLVRASEAEIKTVEETNKDGELVEKKVAPGKGWPINFYSNPAYMGPIPIDMAIQRSCNTVAVKTLDLLTPQFSYDFLTNTLGFHQLSESDIDYSPLALGGMSHGVSVLNMTAAYQIFGNGGLYYEPHSYTRVVDNQGNVLLEANDVPRRVISEDSAEVMNRLLNRVTTGPRGTGTPANLGAMPTIGKTGTSSSDKDQWFMGGTPYYVAGVWYGYDKENAGIVYNSYPPPIIWKRVMSEVHQNLAPKPFPTSGGVVEKSYCVESGDLATSSCPKTATGWYKESSLPGNCTLHSGAIESEEID